MKVVKKIEGQKLILKPKGRIDAVNSPELGQIIEDCLEQAKELELDFSEITYISSACLRILLLTRKKMGKLKKMSITHTNDVVRNILQLSGFDKIIEIG